MITNSVKKARLEAKIALEALYPILHIVTDDYAQVEQVMDDAFYGRSWWDKAPNAYTKGEPSREYVRLTENMSENDLQCLTTGASISANVEKALGDIKKQARKALNACEDELCNPDQTKTAIDKVIREIQKLIDEVDKTSAQNLKEKVFYIRANSEGSGKSFSDKIVALMEQYVELRKRAMYRFPQVDKETLPAQWPRSCMVIYGREAVIPRSIDSSVYRIELEALGEKDFEAILGEFGESNPDVVRWYADWLGGYTESEIFGILREIQACSGGLVNRTNQYAKPIIEQKNQEWVRRHGKLTYEKTDHVEEPKNMDNIGKWVREHKRNIRENTSHDPDRITKGMLLVGVPGTGKSFAAKYIAKLLDLPLYCFKMSNILGQYVSESEKNLAEVIQDVKRAAPCVLFIDEIEKALSGSNGQDGSGGVMQRLFGQLLSFMQDMSKPVFIVATANDVSGFPPEFLRNGRYDARFSMVMPGYSDCVEIMKQKMDKFFGCKDEKAAKFFFEICCGMRPLPGEKKNPRFLTGADINAVVKELYVKLDGKLLGAASYQKYEKEMRSVAETVTMMGETKHPRTIQAIAQCYYRLLAMSVVMVGTGEPLIGAERFKPQRITQYQYQEEDKREGCPTCMDKPKNFEKLVDYDKWLFEAITGEIDRILAKELMAQDPQAYRQFMNHFNEKNT